MYIDFIIVLRKSLFSDILRVAYSLSAFLKMSTNLADLYHSNTDNYFFSTFHIAAMITKNLFSDTLSVAYTPKNENNVSVSPGRRLC